MPMPPPPREKISDADIATVTAWVKAGAPMPDAP
jgi:cytochrome c